MDILKRSVVFAVVAVPALAVAGPAPGSEHKPPVILDEASVHLELFGQGSEGYNFRAHVEISGFSSKTDTARLDWRSKGKVVASAKCDLGLDDNYAYGSCEFREKALKVTGPIEAQLVYWDDQEEKEYLVRTFKVNVHHWKGQWDTWQIAPDDVLASAWMYSANDEAGDSTYRRPALYIWFTDTHLANPVLRCKVGEKKIADIELSEQGGSDTEDIEADHQPKKGDRVTYHWNKKKLLLDVYWGKRSTLKWEYPEKTKADGVLSDNPGLWECGLRNDGKTIRQLRFTVDADGMIQQDEIQTGKNPIPVVSQRVVLIDVRLTKDSATFDKRINPAAMKKSMGFGLPWPDHPKVKEIHASYPAKSGYADPPK
jgi:hypothetical protein